MFSMNNSNLVSNLFELINRIINDKNFQIILISSLLICIWLLSSPTSGLSGLLNEQYLWLKLDIEFLFGLIFWPFLIIVIFYIYGKTKHKSYHKYTEIATLITTIGSFLILTSSFMSTNSNNLNIQNNDMNLKTNETSLQINQTKIDDQKNQNSIKIHFYDSLSWGFLLAGLVLIIFSFFVINLNFR